MQAAYHFYLLLDWEEIEIPRGQEAIRCILKTQNTLGGFHPIRSFSSACEDIDSIDPLVRFQGEAEDRDEVGRALQRALPWVLSNFGLSEGGAVFRRFEPFPYGHTEMLTEANEPSLFATWFRLLSLALIDAYGKVEESRQFHFFNSPGHQFLKDKVGLEY